LSNTKSNWETDIALIKSDIKQIQKFFNKVEDSMDMMVDLSKNVAVQNEVLEFTKEKLDDVEKLCEETKRTDELRMNVLSDRLEEYRRSSKDDHQRLADHNAAKRSDNVKEILESLDRMERAVHQRINEQQKKINHLENWRYYIMGVSAVIMVFIAKWSWPDMFG
jgi:S-adenosylmethionine/arginine decarboxylase-like enzyme